MAASRTTLTGDGRRVPTERLLAQAPVEKALSILAAMRSRGDIALEVLALRRQVTVLKRKQPRPTLKSLDRLFWTTLRHFCSRWPDVLVIVKPETVIGWQRAGFRLYWRWQSRYRSGRPKNRRRDSCTEDNG